MPLRSLDINVLLNNILDVVYTVSSFGPGFGVEATHLAMVAGLLLALCSGITPGGTWETLWSAGDHTNIQGKNLTHCPVSPAPHSTL